VVSRLKLPGLVVPPALLELAGMVAAVRWLVPALADGPVAAMAGFAETPAPTAARAAAAVTVASRVFRLELLRES
jgi:hypothetical protein